MVNEDLHTKDVTLTEASLQAFIGKIKNDIQQSSTRQDFRIVDYDLLRAPTETKPNIYYGEFTEKEVRDNLGNIVIIDKKKNKSTKLYQPVNLNLENNFYKKVNENDDFDESQQYYQINEQNEYIEADGINSGNYNDNKDNLYIAFDPDPEEYIEATVYSANEQYYLKISDQQYIPVDNVDFNSNNTYYTKKTNLSVLLNNEYKKCQFIYDDNTIYIGLTTDSYNNINELLNYTYYEKDQNSGQYNFTEKLEVENNINLIPKEYYKLDNDNLQLQKTEQEYQIANFTQNLDTDNDSITNYYYATTKLIPNPILSDDEESDKSIVVKNEDKQEKYVTNISLEKVTIQEKIKPYIRYFIDTAATTTDLNKNPAIHPTDKTVVFQDYTINTGIVANKATPKVNLRYNYIYPVKAMSITSLTNSITDNNKVEALFGQGINFLNNSTTAEWSFRGYKEKFSTTATEVKNSYKDQYIYDLNLYSDITAFNSLPKYQNEYYNGSLAFSYLQQLTDNVPRSFKIEATNITNDTEVFTDINNKDLYFYSKAFDSDTTISNEDLQNEVEGSNLNVTYYKIEYQLCDDDTKIDAWNRENPYGASQSIRIFQLVEGTSFDYNDNENSTTTYTVSSDHKFHSTSNELDIISNDDIQGFIDQYFNVNKNDYYDCFEELREMHLDDSTPYFERKITPIIFSCTKDSNNNIIINNVKVGNDNAITLEQFNTDCNYCLFRQEYKESKLNSVLTDEYNVTFTSLYNNYYLFKDEACIFNSFSLHMNNTTSTSKVQARKLQDIITINNNSNAKNNILTLFNNNATTAVFTLPASKTITIDNDGKEQISSDVNSEQTFTVTSPSANRTAYVLDMIRTKDIMNSNKWETGILPLSPNSSNKIKYGRYYPLNGPYSTTRTAASTYAANGYLNLAIMYIIKQKYKNKIYEIDENTKYYIIPGIKNANTENVFYFKKVINESSDDFYPMSSKLYKAAPIYDASATYYKKNEDGSYSITSDTINNDNYHHYYIHDTTFEGKVVDYPTTATYNKEPWIQIITTNTIFTDIGKNKNSGKIKEAGYLSASTNVHTINNNMTTIYYKNPINNPTTASYTLASGPNAFANIILDAVYNNATLAYTKEVTLSSTYNAIKSTAYRTFTVKANETACYNSGYVRQTDSFTKFTPSSEDLDNIIIILNNLYADFWYGNEDEEGAKTLNIDKSTTSAKSAYDAASTELSRNKEILMYEYNKNDFEDEYKLPEDPIDPSIKNIKFEISGQKSSTNDSILLSATKKYLYVVPTNNNTVLNKIELQNYISPPTISGGYNLYLSSENYTEKDNIDFSTTSIVNDKIDSLNLAVTELNKEGYFPITESTTASQFQYAKKFKTFLKYDPSIEQSNTNNNDDIYIEWTPYININKEYFPLYKKTNGQEEYSLSASIIEPINSAKYNLELKTSNIPANIVFYEDTKNNINSGRHLFLENYARRLSYIESFSQDNPYPDTNYKLNKLGVLINKDTQEEKILNGTFSIKNPFGDIGTLVKINGYDNEGNLVDPSVSGIISINDESDAWRKPIIDKMTSGIKIAPQNENGTIYASIVTKGGIAAAKTIKGERLYGAVWNDYAEYRQTPNVAPGRCVIEQGDGTLHQSTERLQPGASIVSDTYGFGVGETALAKTPIAVSGRVLAYPYEDRNSYKPGAAVCSGPNGTISMMTREEIREWPDCIVGTVSEIPQYEKWGTDAVNVDGRIWIKIK